MAIRPNSVDHELAIDAPLSNRHPHPASPAPQGRFAEFGGGGSRRLTEGVKNGIQLPKL